MNTNHHLSGSIPGEACAAFAPLLPLVAQRLLEPDEAAALQTHVAGCRRCQAGLAAYDRLDSALRRHVEQIDSSPFRMEDLMSRIRDEEQLELQENHFSAPPIHAPSAPLHHRRRPRRIFSWLAAVAAVLVIALITTALVVSRHPTIPVVKRQTTATTQPGQTVPDPMGIYVTTYAWPPSTTQPQVVYALDPRHGSTQWQYQVPAGLTTQQPVFDHGKLYLIIQDDNAEVSARNAIYALDARNGNLLWQTSLGDFADYFLVVNGAIYAGTHSGVVYALNASDGGVKWHTAVGDLAEVDQIVDGVVYVDTTHSVVGAAVTGELFALNASDGAVKWHFTLHGSGRIIAVSNGQVDVLDESVQVVDDGNVHVNLIISWFYTLKASDGSVKWSFPGDPATLGGAIATQDTVYLTLLSGSVQQRHATTLEALNAGDGSVRWQKALADPDLTGLIAQNGIVYLGASGDTIYALHAQDGSEAWHTQIGAGAAVAKLVDGVVYAGTRTALHALKASDGTIKWDYAGASFGQIANVVNNVVYAYSRATQSTVFALDASGGSQLWHLDFGQISPVSVG